MSSVSISASRMQMRRFTRLTNGFSKRLESHRAAVHLWVCFYNLCRYHETLRCTPAMALGSLITSGRLRSLYGPLLSVKTCRLCRDRQKRRSGRDIGRSGRS